jgi:purine-binding chemotaxis protein CheW
MSAKANAKPNVITQKLVAFQLGVDLFAAEVLSVERVLRYEQPKSVPDVPPWIEGVLEHRGKIIPIVDLRKRIELAAFEITPETRILVFTTTDGLVGAIVDAVLEVAAVPADAITTPPKLFRGVSAEFVKGIAKLRDQLIVVLDVERVLASTDRIALEQFIQAMNSQELAGRG